MKENEIDFAGAVITKDQVKELNALTHYPEWGSLIAWIESKRSGLKEACFRNPKDLEGNMARLGEANGREIFIDFPVLTKNAVASIKGSEIKN